MVEAILFDLDDTLLRSDMSVFMRPYFALLGRRISGLLPMEVMRSHLDRGVEAMLRNNGSPKTNEEAFMEVFFDGLDVPKDILMARFKAFYEEDFDQLRTYTQSKPEARPLVQDVFRMGYRVVIATQPMFPLVAVRSRLEWAGVADFPYEWITSYEVMHACKPHPAYYQEIADHLGLPPEACLMAGDSVQMDMVAGGIGMRTFWVTDSLEGTPPLAKGSLDGQGELDELYRLVRSGALRQW